MSSTTEEERPSQLVDALGVLRRRWTIVAATVVLVPLAVLGWASYSAANATPVFEATHRLAINPERGISNFTLTQAAVLVNDGDAGSAAREELAGHPGVGVRAETDLSVGAVEIVAVGPDPEEVRVVADTYADALLGELAQVDDAAAGATLSEQRERAEAVEAEVIAAREAIFANPEDRQSQIEFDDALARYEAALAEVRRTETIGTPPAPLRSLSASSVREAPADGLAGSGGIRQVLSALLIAAVLGIALAYGWESVDSRLVDADRVGRTFGVPVLTEVPDGGKGFAGANTLAPPASVISEAYRRLRTILRLEHRAGGVVVLITSPSPSEGKTTTVAHLARALGEVGARVLAVSADFRRPQLHHYFGVEATPPGISAPTPSADDGADDHVATPRIIQSTGIPGVSIATAGLGTSDPTDLISYARRLISRAHDHYDYVLIDTSPILSANDALEFVDDVDAVVLIARSGSTTRPAAERTRDLLLGVGAPVLGVVLTGVKDHGRYGYYYGPDRQAAELVEIRQVDEAATS